MHARLIHIAKNKLKTVMSGPCLCLKKTQKQTNWVSAFDIKNKSLTGRNNSMFGPVEHNLKI